jgi:lipoate-protein ligase A
MAILFRVIDTGVRDGRFQIAFDQALIDLHGGGRVPDTIRFLRFEPSALVGRHQAIGQELKLDFCRSNGVALVRRITGGGAIYLDPNQVGWELVLSRTRLPMSTLADYTRAICEAVAFGLSKSFAIEARYRPRNDIEVGGQKLCGTGGFFDGDTLFYQGTVLVDADPARITSCLNVPEAKLKKRGIDKAEQRVTTLKTLLGGRAPDISAVHEAVLLGLAERLGIAIENCMPTEEEKALAARLSAEEIGTEEFVFSIDDPRGAGVLEASHTGPGGTVTAYVRLEGGGKARRIREVLLTGDFFVTPPRLIFDLEASLRGAMAADAGAAVDRFFAATRPDLLTISPADFRTVVEAAVRSDTG